MQYSTIGDIKVSRIGLGTKRMPTEDSRRVIHLDFPIAGQIIDASLAEGINYFDTSYSNHKGEAENYLGEFFAEPEKKVTDHHVATQFFEMVDPRYEYVFQKQLKKLQTDCIDFYYLESVGDITRLGLEQCGVVDFLFKMKEEGKINQLGFSCEMKPNNQEDFQKKYPWDFVRMSMNYFDYFQRDARPRYEIACEAGLPIIAHAPLRVGSREQLKMDALDVLRDANPERSSVDWGIRFVKSLEGINVVTINAYSVDQIQENAAVFHDDIVLSANEFEVLREASLAQKTIRPTKK